MADLKARYAAYEELRRRYPDALPAGHHVGTGSRLIIAGDSIPILSVDIPIGAPGTPTLDEALAVFAPHWIQKPERPRIVCLCGSTRFYDAFREANLRLTLEGNIVLTIGCDTKSDADLGIVREEGGNVTAAKVALDELHKRKIDLADEVLVLNVDGYIGDSTRSEIAYAQQLGKPISYLVEVPDGEA